MIVLGMDLGAHTGFAIAAQHDTLRICWSRKYPDGPLCRPERLAGLRADLQSAIEEWAPGLIAYELPLSRGQHAKRNLFGYAAVVEATAYAAGIPSLDVNVGAVKRHACAAAMAGKEPIIAAARLLGFVPQNEHEADASVLADLVARKMVVEAAVTKGSRRRRAA